MKTFKMPKLVVEQPTIRVRTLEEAMETRAGIEKLLRAVLGRADYIAKGLCVCCQEDAREFADMRSWMQYKQDGLCQQCQDELRKAGEL